MAPDPLRGSLNANLKMFIEETFVVLVGFCGDAFMKLCILVTKDPPPDAEYRKRVKQKALARPYCKRV